MMPLSKPDLIKPDASSPAKPPAKIYGNEPQPDWCYYFEKAELARQSGDWSLVSNMGDQALATGQRLYEVNAPELTTYIEGYAHTGRWEDAIRLTDETLLLSERMDRMLCDTWNRILSQTPDNPNKEAALSAISEKLPCLR